LSDPHDLLSMAILSSVIVRDPIVKLHRTFQTLTSVTIGGALPMWLWIAGISAVITFGSLIVLVRHRVRRRQALSRLADRRSEWVAKYPVQIASTADCRVLARAFSRERIVRIANFLVPECLQRLRVEAENNIPRMVPSYIPTHKKGHTLSYENIHHNAHGCLGLYHSPGLQRWISEITGLDVRPTPDRDQSSLSVLCYKDAGDHINWHYDHNFYRGRHFTVLLSLANESRGGDLSQSQLMTRSPAGDETIDTAPDVLVVFEGAKVLHRASPTAEGDLRIMLSMTYCADSRTSWMKEFARRVKDTAFYGIRALWD
jgi:hypothetical protein